MKRFLLCLLFASPAFAEPLSETDSKEVSAIITKAGLSCPKALDFKHETDDARGGIYLINCQSRDGQKTWALRLIQSPNGSYRVEIL